MRKPLHSRALAILLVVASAIPAFRDWQGLRFGLTKPGSMQDRPFGVGKLAKGRLVVAGRSNDSTCCRLDSAGEFGGIHPSMEGLPFVGVPDPTRSFEPVLQWGVLRGGAPTWYDLQPDPRGGFLTAGAIGDTLLFTGRNRVWFRGITPDSTSEWDDSAQVARGGGGGVGVGFWTSTDQMRLRLLRFPWLLNDRIAWQVLVDSAGFTVAGWFEAFQPGLMYEGENSFAFPASVGACFLFHAGEPSGPKWFATLPCPLRGVPGEAVRYGSRIWATFNDSHPEVNDDSGMPWYHGMRPGLARFDLATGMELDRVHPFGSMHGVVQSIARDENGNLLLQGEQSSSFEGPGGIVVPVLDTVHGQDGWADSYSISSGWLGLLDSSGTLLRFRSLHGLENAGGWKLRRVQGMGWLGLNWDHRDVLGWSRIYLFDDTLGVIEASPRLPNAMDIELGPDGEILLTGVVRAQEPAASFLRGTGSMWVASCRLGAEPATGIRPPRGGDLGLWHRGRFLEVNSSSSAAIRLRAFDPGGRLLLDRNVGPGAKLQVPRGLSLWTLQQGTGILRERILVP